MFALEKLIVIVSHALLLSDTTFYGFLTFEHSGSVISFMSSSEGGVGDIFGA